MSDDCPTGTPCPPGPVNTVARAAAEISNAVSAEMRSATRGCAETFMKCSSPIRDELTRWTWTIDDETRRLGCDKHKRWLCPAAIKMATPTRQLTQWSSAGRTRGHHGYSEL